MPTLSLFEVFKRVLQQRGEPAALQAAALRYQGRTPTEICVASCYFNPQGLQLIAEGARHIPRVRLLLGADTTPACARR